MVLPYARHVPARVATAASKRFWGVGTVAYPCKASYGPVYCFSTEITRRRRPLDALSGGLQGELIMPPMIQYEEVVHPKTPDPAEGPEEVWPLSPKQSRKALLGSLMRCKTQGNWQEARTVLFAAHTAEVELDAMALSMAIASHKKLGRWREATELLTEMFNKKLPVDESVVNAAISVCAQARKWQEAATLVADMPQHRLKPNRLSYTAAIHAAARADEPAAAIRLLEQMRKQKLSPDIIVYTSVIWALASKGKGKEALRLLEQAKEDGLTPSTRLYNAVMGTFAASGDYTKSAELLEQMQHAGRAARPDLITFNTAMKAAGTRGPEIKVLFQKIRAAGFTPDVVTYNTALTGLVAGKHWDQVDKLLKDMTGDKVKFSGGTHHQALMAAAGQGQFDRAQQHLEQMMESGTKPGVGTYGVMAAGLIEAGDQDAANRMYAQAVEQGHVSHWNRQNPDTVDLRMFPAPLALTALRHVLDDMRRHHGGQTRTRGAGGSSGHVHNPRTPLVVVTGGGTKGPKDKQPRGEHGRQLQEALLTFLWKSCRPAISAVALKGNLTRVVASSQELSRWLGGGSKFVTETANPVRRRK